METSCTLALGLSAPWRVINVDLQPAVDRIVFKVENNANRQACPACGAADQPNHNRLPRRWQHLNFFQLKAIIETQVPRVGCRTCEKTTQAVPRARPGSGFSQAHEAFVAALCWQMLVVVKPLGVSDDRMWRILDAHVEVARAREDYAEVRRINADERSARRGQHFLTIFCDLDTWRLLFATLGWDAATFKAFAEGCAKLKHLPKNPREHAAQRTAE